MTETVGSRPTRRTLLFGGLKLAALAAVARAVPVQAGGFTQAAGIAAKASGSTLVLLGTQGGPSVNLGRGEAANAVLVDGRPYLIDCGYGTLRALVQAGIPYNDVASVFLTHLHDDHTTDVAALLSHKWTGGRAQATTVYGPHGTSALVEGALAYLKANADIRTTDEGRTERPESVFRGRNLEAGAQPVEVFRDDRIAVQAVENAHFPERARARMPYRSLAYRFTTASRSFVFSGDTAYSTGLVELARGADILVCEAIETALHQQLERTARETEAKTGNPNSIARHVVETHSTTEDVGRMAAEAKVKTVVLSHLLPGSNPQRGAELPDSAFILGVKKHFDGEVIVGRDQMRL